MIVQFIKSACVIVEHDGIRVLCDPWLTDGIYYGSWYHYPPLKFKPEDFSDVDYIYISHVHPDHLDTEALKRLPKHIPVLIANYKEKFVRNIISQIGFEKIIEVIAEQPLQLSDDFRIEILGSDFCDPTLCGRSFRCAPGTHLSSGSIDSLAVFHGGGVTVVNTNDCIYNSTKSACDYVANKYPEIDLLLTGYAGAGPYPQCYVYNDPSEYQQRAESKKLEFLNRCANYIGHLKPQYFLPFAGQYTLGGHLAKLNSIRGVPELEELEDSLLPILRSRGLDSQMVLLNPGETFDVQRKVASAPYTPIDLEEKARYIREVLEPKKYVYELEPMPETEELAEMLRMAQSRLIERLRNRGLRPSLYDWKVCFPVGKDDQWLGMSMLNEGVNWLNEFEIQPPYIKIELDPRLLKMILQREAHFNNAEIGSHLRLLRNPDEYDVGLFVCLYYLHL